MRPKIPRNREASQVTQLLTLDRRDFENQAPAGGVPGYLMTDVDAGLRLVLVLDL